MLGLRDSKSQRGLFAMAPIPGRFGLYCRSNESWQSPTSPSFLFRFLNRSRGRKIVVSLKLEKRLLLFFFYGEAAGVACIGHRFRSTKRVTVREAAAPLFIRFLFSETHGCALFHPPTSFVPETIATA